MFRGQFNAWHVHIEPTLLSTDMIRDTNELQRGVVRIWSHPLLQSNAHSCTLYCETDKLLWGEGTLDEPVPLKSSTLWSLKLKPCTAYSSENQYWIWYCRRLGSITTSSCILKLHIWAVLIAWGTYNHGVFYDKVLNLQCIETKATTRRVSK